MAKINVQVKSVEGSAARDTSAAAQQMRQQVWNANPAQIETRIETLTSLAQAKLLLTVLTLALKDHERRIRELESNQ